MLCFRFFLDSCRIYTAAVFTYCLKEYVSISEDFVAQASLVGQTYEPRNKHSVPSAGEELQRKVRSGKQGL